MAKQLSLKQQLINQLAQQTVAQLNQAQNQQNNIQQLQAEYDAWNQQQQLQNEYDAWLKSQQTPQPVTEQIAQPTKPKATQIPSLSADEFRKQKIANRAPILEQIAAKKAAEEEAKARYDSVVKDNATRETLGRLGVMTAIEQDKLAQKAAERKELENAILNVDNYMPQEEKALTPQEAAFEEQILNVDKYNTEKPKEEAQPYLADQQKDIIQFDRQDAADDQHDRQEHP